MTNKEIRALIKKNSLRATTTRIAVASTLMKSDRPLSHSELVQELAEISSDQATIYRTLITFVNAELIRIVSNVGGIARYEFVDTEQKSQHVHPHFVCKACGVVSCLPKTTITHAVDPDWREILLASEVQFLGTCTKCA